MTETFSDLPDALVRDLLAAAEPIAQEVQADFRKLKERRAQLRQVAHDRYWIRRKADLDIVREPSVVGVDGSYQLHRLTAVDLCAAAAVAIEGTSKEARRHWAEPYHVLWARTLPHSEDTVLALRGLMISQELSLASNAPHDLVLLDGSYSSLIIYLNQGLTSAKQVGVVGEELLSRWKQGLGKALLRFITSERSLAIPKYTSRNELRPLQKDLALDPYDGRTIATLILEPGEYTAPMPVFVTERGEAEAFHLPADHVSKDEMADLNDALRAVHAVYYRPFGWVPALRLEVPGVIANSPLRTSMVLRGIEGQFFSPAVSEPYPLFLADRMVKSLGAGVAVMENTISQQLMDEGTDLELTMLLLKNYRTEGGRGGN